MKPFHKFILNFPFNFLKNVRSFIYLKADFKNLNKNKQEFKLSSFLWVEAKVYFAKFKQAFVKINSFKETQNFKAY